MRTIILGAGITGLTSAFELKKNKLDYFVLEKEKNVGGLCKSVNLNDFIFDYTGHYLHFSDKEIENFVKYILDDNIIKVKRNAKIFIEEASTKDKLVPYPFQANIRYLKKEIKKKSIFEIINSELKKSTSLINRIDNFYDWLKVNFGVTITNIFFKPYNEKLWRVSIKEISTDWTKKFVPTPNLEDIIDSLLNKNEKNYGYNTYFYYPKRGGIQSLIDALYSKLDKEKVLVSSDVVKIDLKNKKVFFLKNNKLENIKYDKIISTIPLRNLVNITNVDKKIKNYAKNLRYSSVNCFNFALKNLNINKLHWIYFPSSDIKFYRIGFYSNVTKNMVPDKKFSSMYVEVSSENSMIDSRTTYKEILKGLLYAKILNSPNDILFYNILRIPIAYVTYDKHRAEFLPIIHKNFRKNQIYSIGRYGEWKYSYMSENIKDAIDTVKNYIL
ncbi:MAG: FAD-dependent oxidoreductase [Endomicrobia bacterium]|nr:FAD-dependent oxidoreductase [Endomicrobiia bacterium]